MPSKRRSVTTIATAPAQPAVPPPPTAAQKKILAEALLQKLDKVHKQSAVTAASAVPTSDADALNISGNLPPESAAESVGAPTPLETTSVGTQWTWELQQEAVACQTEPVATEPATKPAVAQHATQTGTTVKDMGTLVTPKLLGAAPRHESVQCELLMDRRASADPTSLSELASKNRKEQLAPAPRQLAPLRNIGHMVTQEERDLALFRSQALADEAEARTASGGLERGEAMSPAGMSALARRHSWQPRPALCIANIRSTRWYAAGRSSSLSWRTLRRSRPGSPRS
jgi:hypothetical protein